MKIFSVGDVDLKYRVEGEAGRVMLLLHGFGGGPQDWISVVPELAKTYRVIALNMKPFFSHREPISFSRQVEILVQFVREIYRRKNVASVSLMGQSYGATLALGLLLQKDLRIEHATFLNPMPFRPFEMMRNPHIRVLLNLGVMPGGLRLFLKSKMGRQGLEELAKVFRIGTAGPGEIHHINERKLALVEKAFDRFRWIVKREKWAEWENQLPDLSPGSVARFVYSSGDSLFSPEDYRHLAKKFGALEVIEIPHQGHLLLQDVGLGVLPK